MPVRPRMTQSYTTNPEQKISTPIHIPQVSRGRFGIAIACCNEGASSLRSQESRKRRHGMFNGPTLLGHFDDPTICRVDHFGGEAEHGPSDRLGLTSALPSEMDASPGNRRLLQLEIGAKAMQSAETRARSDTAVSLPKDL
jgi:hypothetical protein